MKKGERVLCLKRQLSAIPGFQLTLILSTWHEYLSEKKNPTSMVFSSSQFWIVVFCLVVWLVFCFIFTFNWTFHFTEMNFLYPISFPRYKALRSHCCGHSKDVFQCLPCDFVRAALDWPWTLNLKSKNSFWIVSDLSVLLVHISKTKSSVWGTSYLIIEVVLIFVCYIYTYSSTYTYARTHTYIYVYTHSLLTSSEFFSSSYCLFSFLFPLT